MTSFLILHGWQNHRPEGHWQRELAERLTALGHRVDYPQLPDPDAPDLGAWLAVLRGTPADADRVVVCHSLACLLWLHALADTAHAPPAARVLLVAPPSPELVAGHPEIAAFVPPSAVRPGPGTRLVAGDDDPWCPDGALRRFAEPLGVDIDVIPGGGHLNPASGYGEWPDVLAWCLDGTARIGARTAGVGTP